jgi:hypothetical protein
MNEPVQEGQDQIVIVTNNYYYAQLFYSGNNILSHNST